MIQNRYARDCAVCATHVPVGAGVAEEANGKWRTLCGLCAGVVTDPKPAVSVEVKGPYAVIRPTGFLGPQAFTIYRSSCVGGSYDRTLRGTVALLSVAGSILMVLHEAGFVVRIAPDGAEAILAARRKDGNTDYIPPFEGMARVAAEEDARVAEARALAEQRVREFAEKAKAACRPPKDAVESWAAAGLLQLAALDPDRASERNNAGFSGADGAPGHRLAQKVQALGGLTDPEWTAAVAMCRKYVRQIGTPPALEASSAA